MKPRLVSDWRSILKRAWSIRLMIVAGIFSGLEVALPFVDGYLPVGQGVFAALSGITTAAAFVTRLLAQSSLGDAK